jgi:hypothetical protein
MEAVKFVWRNAGRPACSFVRTKRRQFTSERAIGESELADLGGNGLVTGTKFQVKSEFRGYAWIGFLGMEWDDESAVE